MELQEVKDYLRIDSNDDDALLQSLIVSSDQYLKNAGCDSSENPELYATAQKLLISHWYENRGPAVVGATATMLDHSLQSMILQLKSFPSDETDGVETG